MVTKSIFRCFYYRDAHQDQYKSTKIIKEDSNNSRKHKHKEVGARERRNNVRSANEGTLFEQPSIISFEDVEG